MTFIRIAISVIEHVPDGDVHREVGETCFRSLAGQNAPTRLNMAIGWYRSVSKFPRSVEMSDGWTEEKWYQTISPYSNYPSW
ncbi:hypothetical protein BELL_0002g00510 [Botrytis elliptica]|uniref:Uncharacterized protein n=1 Tax=Botrytis elliptica TaxID=278938 RepID=A0A4Z1K3Q2_9HELO|nr:hypothetical protein BELL_0002g00510 [Botrytis elliptica]